MASNESCNNIEDLYQEEIALESISEKIKQMLIPKKLAKLFIFLSLIIIIMLSNNIKISNDKRNIHIAININKKHFYPSLVFLTSLLENQKPDSYYVIHVLKGKNINFKHYRKIIKLIKKKEKYIHHNKVKFYDMENEFKRVTHGIYISEAEYYRITLPSLLPNLDKIIYINTDVITFKDLGEMYSIELEDDIYFMGILDNNKLPSKLKNIKDLKKNMNEGILIMNLKSLRKYGIEEDLRNYVSAHYLKSHNQTAINVVCHDHLGILSIKYATFSYKSFKELVKYNKKQQKQYRYSKDELLKVYHEPTLLYFFGSVKPWHKKYKKKNQKYWWYYAKKSGYYKKILKYYKFPKKTVNKLIKKIPKNIGILK